MPEGRMPISVLIGTEVSSILICTVGFGSEVGFGITESGKVSASLGELAWGQDEDAGGQGCLPRSRCGEGCRAPHYGQYTEAHGPSVAETRIRS